MRMILCRYAAGTGKVEIHDQKRCNRARESGIPGAGRLPQNPDSVRRTKRPMIFKGSTGKCSCTPKANAVSTGVSGHRGELAEW